MIEKAFEDSRRWQQLNELFAEASVLSEHERKRMLRRIADTALRAELRSMLTAADRAASVGFLGAGGLDAVAHVLGDRPAAEPERRTVGSYEIIREIGRGGMGAIYLARHSDFGQNVAVKIIKRGMDTEAILHRFDRERQTLASLDHPNIAHFIDGGTTEDGLPYFVMEYVDGLPITTYCDKARLTIDQRLTIFRKVCSAVAHAHRNLVVHRDIKPTNVLVSADGEPKLVDFGISKLLSPDRQQTETAPELRLLTPEYASPEQVCGDAVTTATDVYSLGVLLYELLCGRRPFALQGRPSADALRAIIEKMPVAPSTAAATGGADRQRDTDPAVTVETLAGSRRERPDRLFRKLKGDLDNIVLMALRKEPERRYSTVEEFSEDIRKHLEHLPVVARRATFYYQATKFLERNTVVSTVAMIALTAVLAVTSVALWKGEEARRERERAVQRFGDLRSLANTLIDGWDAGLPHGAVSEQGYARLADLSSVYLEGLRADAGDDRELLLEVASAYMKVGHKYSYLAIDEEKADASFRAAEQIARELLARSPEDLQAQRLLLRYFDETEDSTLDLGADAYMARRSAIVELLEDIYSGQPFDQRMGKELGTAYAFMATGNRLAGHTDEAAVWQTKAIDMYRRRVEILQGADDHEGRMRLVSAYLDLASDRARTQGEVAAAVDDFRRAHAIAQEVFEDRPDDNTSWILMSSTEFELGLSLKMAGSFEESVGHFTACADVAGRRNLSGLNSFFVRKVSDCTLEASESLYELGRRADALAALNKAVRMWAEWDSANPDRNASSHFLSRARFYTIAARLFERMGRHREAVDSLREADSSYEAAGENSRENAISRRAKARFYLTKGDILGGLRVCSALQNAVSGDIGVASYCWVKDVATFTGENARRQASLQAYREAILILGRVNSSGIYFADDQELLKMAQRKIQALDGHAAS